MKVAIKLYLQDLRIQVVVPMHRFKREELVFAHQHYNNVCRKQLLFVWPELDDVIINFYFT